MPHVPLVVGAGLSSLKASEGGKVPGMPCGQVLTAAHCSDLAVKSTQRGLGACARSPDRKKVKLLPTRAFMLRDQLRERLHGYHLQKQAKLSPIP